MAPALCKLAQSIAQTMSDLLINAKAQIACDQPLAAGMSLEEVQDLFHANYGDNSRETPRQTVSVEAA